VVKPTTVAEAGTAVPEWVGVRWTPGPIERRDTARGFYEAVNSAPEGEALRIQRALISRPIPRRVPWQLYWLLIAVGAVIAAWSLR
jgi:hypothetical protein